MKNVLLIALFALKNVALSAATYYIDQSGNNSNNGSQASPWKTLSYACSMARSSGDIIHVNSGVYVETAQSLLAVGVSIEGEGSSSVILSNVSATNTFTLLLSSTSEGTNGNQHISKIKMDGNGLVAFGAIKVMRRSNVSIYDCVFENFRYYGVHFLAGAEPPTVHAKGNKFYNNTVTNCSGFFGEGKFAVGVDGQDGLLIYGNKLDQTSRSAGNNGYLIKGVEGYNKGMKIYNNTLTLAPYYPGTFGFAIELWDCRGGVEIYDNVITGTIDIGGYHTRKETYPYAVYIHDNVIGPNSLSIYEGVKGVILEGDIADVIVSNNHIKNVTNGIFFSQVGSARTVNNVYLYSNIIENIGVADGGSDSKGWGINWTEESYHNHVVDNINIWNNVITGNAGARTNMWGIKLPNIGKATNISIRNNIVKDFDSAPIYARAHAGVETISNLSLENNIFYQNGNRNLPLYSGITPSNNTTQNNIIANPLFVSTSNFRLQSGSPAIGAGLRIATITTDFEGSATKNPPSIGAYEYSSAAPSPVLPVYQSSAVENATANTLDIFYDQSLASVAPTSSAFSVLVDGTARNISSVSVSGTRVRILLLTPVASGNVITLSYTKPASNPLQTAAGAEAVSFSARTVTNNVAGVAPVFVNSIVANSTPTILDMNYDQALANLVPDKSAFVVQVNGANQNISSVEVSGTKVQITLPTAIVYGNVVTVSYTKPTSNPLQTASGVQLASLATQPVANNVAGATPVFVNSLVGNATPSILEMNYDQALANLVPDKSAFKVQVNGTTRNISSVAVSGTRVQITLLTAIVYGNVVTVAYTKPTINPLQTASGVQLASLATQPVDNNVVGAAPVFVNSLVGNASPAILEMNYDQVLANLAPDISAFKVQVNGNTRNISSVAVSGTKVQITLLTAIVYGNVVTVAYTKPANNPLQTTSGVHLSSLAAQPVVNNVAGEAPVFVSSVVENSAPTMLNMTYNQSLSSITPASSAFKVQVNGTTRNISSVAVSGTRVQITLLTPIVYGNTVTVSYTKPATSPLQTSVGVHALSLNTQSVTNNVASTGSLSNEDEDTEQVTGLEDSRENELRIFPNPAVDFFNVSCEEPAESIINVIVSDISGKIVVRDLLEQGITNANIPVDLKTGLYIVTLESRGKILKTHKLMINR